MADLKTFSGLKKQNLVIPAYSMQSVFFDTINPNYYRVHNHGTATLYCATSHQPTENQYDFAVGGEQIKAYAEPFDRNVLFIFNPSGSDIAVSLLTFNAEFDPLALILADLTLDFSGTTIESSTVIQSFNTPLPEGQNKIGSVSVDNQKDYTNVLSYIENHLSTLKANQKDYTANLAAILTALADCETVDYSASLSAILTALGNCETIDHSAILEAIEANQKDYTAALSNILTAIGNISVSGGDGGGEPFYSSIQAFNGVDLSAQQTINESGNIVIHFLTNDGDGQMTVYFGGLPVLLKAGESIQDFKFTGSVSVGGTNYSYRAMVTKG